MNESLKQREFLNSFWFASGSFYSELEFGDSSPKISQTASTEEPGPEPAAGLALLSSPNLCRFPKNASQNKSPRVCSAFSSISRSVQPPNGRRLSANAARRWLFGSISYNPLLAGRGRCCDLHKSWTKFDLEVWRGREVAFIMARCWSSLANPELIIAFKRTASNIDQTFIPFSAFVIKINFWASFLNVKQNVISSSLSLKISFLNSFRCISYLHQFWWRMLHGLLDL